MPDPNREAGIIFFREPRRDVEGWRGQDFLHKVYTDLDAPAAIEEFSIHPGERARDAEVAREFFARKKTAGHVDGGEAVEAMLNVELDLSNWFGGVTFRTTRYDDMKGVDAVIEWNAEETYGFVPRLAVDFSGSENSGRVAEKLDKLKNGTRVKYFRSQVERDDDGSEVEMTLEKMPTVVLGIDAALTEGIGQFALLHKTTRAGKERLPARLFAEHPIRQLLLEQAAVQIDKQIRDEAIRLEQFLSQQSDLSEDVSEALYQYRSLMQRSPLLNAQAIVDLFLPVTNSLQALSDQMGRPAPRAFRGGDEKLPPTPWQTLSRWRNLVAVRELVGEKLKQTKAAARAAEVGKWRQASQTHALLTKAA